MQGGEVRNLECAATVSPPPSPPRGCYFEAAGWCVGNDDCSVGYQNSIQTCWDVCYTKYGSGLVAVDMDEGNGDGDCYTDETTNEFMCHCCCQTACPYCDGAGGESMIVASGTGQLPISCGVGDTPLVCD